MYKERQKNTGSVFSIEIAKMEEAEVCSKIIDDGKMFQKEQGFVQWTGDYPNLHTIYDDIKESKGYVIKADEKIAGYVCIDFSGEPAYAKINGAWNAERDYAVVHRMAFGKEFVGIGLSDVAFTLIERVCVDKNISYIRIDTDSQNKRMQHILKKNGFVRCGTVFFRDSEKIAYDKQISEITKS